VRPVQLICVLHRLAGRTGHRFNQALGLEEEARRRGMAPLLLIHAEAEREVRAALPAARAVLHDPVFRAGSSFAERTADFVAMLHRHLDAGVRRDDWVLMTIATQCEARAMALWSRQLPARAKPWILVLFPADRWNRAGAAERERQLAELRELGAELRAMPAADRRRLVFASHTEGLAAELERIVGTPFAVCPMIEPNGGLELTEPAEPAACQPPRVAVVGGARREKGSHRVRAIATACRQRTAVRFLVQIANETLSPAELAELEGIAGDPHTEVLHGPLGREEYVRALRESDLLLLPYDSIPYRQRPSGILSEAVLCGLPIVAPRGSWLGEQIEEGRAAGVAYGDLEPEREESREIEAAAEAVALALADLEPLRARARALAPAWRRAHSPRRFLDWLEGEIAERSRTERSGHRRSWRERFF
jgi:glycosyltransferase involved in cell wall biosynthesis